MWLTKESFIALIGFGTLFLIDTDIQEEFNKLIKSEKIDGKIPFIASKNILNKLNIKVCESEKCT